MHQFGNLNPRRSYKSFKNNCSGVKCTAKYTLVEYDKNKSLPLCCGCIVSPGRSSILLRLDRIHTLLELEHSG